MNGILLIIPLFLIRYGLLSIINKATLSKAAFFPPMRGIERSMYLLYQIATIFLIIYPLFLTVSNTTPYIQIGLVTYVVGILLLIWSTISFSKPDSNGICQSGLFRFSRNPMYIAYFIYFLGCVLLTQSIILFLGLCIFQISAHWIILSEERWCIEEFGNEYTQYMKKVRRYL